MSVENVKVQYYILISSLVFGLLTVIYLSATVHRILKFQDFKAIQNIRQKENKMTFLLASQQHLCSKKCKNGMEIIKQMYEFKNVLLNYH